MSKKVLIIIGVILVLVTSAGAVLFTTFIGKQEGNIQVIGFNGTGMFTFNTVINGSLRHLDMTNLSIPYDFTVLNAGDYRTQACSIYNNDPVNSYRVTYSIDNSWFNNPNHTWYGFTYGIKDYVGNNIIGSYTFPPNYNSSFYFWYRVNPIMMTPYNGTVHPTIGIVATKI